MPDTRKGHNPSGAPDPTRARAENNIQKDEKRVHDLIHVLRYVADGWHISDLKIYDRPRPLSDFTRLRATKFGYEPVEIRRPPQSWFYVEDAECTS